MESKLNSKNQRKLKTKLYFLGNPRNLLYGDVHRHVCLVCLQVFHFPLALEWHMGENHVSDLTRFRKALDNSTNKRQEAVKRRVLPLRLAAARGSKRCRLQLEGEEIKKEFIEIDRDTYSDLDLFLDDSIIEEEQCAPRQLGKELRVMTVKLSFPIKDCQVLVERLFLGDKHSIDIQYDDDDGDNEGVYSSDSDIEIEFAQISDSGSDLEVLFQNEFVVSALQCNNQDVDTLLSQEIINLSLSSHSPSSQPSKWTAPENETDKDLETLSKLSQVKDKVKWVWGIER